MVGREAAVGGVHWKGKDERVGVWAGVVLSPTKAFPEPADSGWLKRVCPGEELPAVTKVLSFWRVGKDFWSKVEDGMWQSQGTPGLPCKGFSISTGMALREAHESLVTVALCQAAERCQAAGPKGVLSSPAGAALLVPHRCSLVAETR